jgi:predicted DCC family thiol-disulfide oxidoreductase YuxK
MFVVFYDGWCPFCTTAAERTKKADIQSEVTFVSFREAHVVESYAVPPHLLKEMEVRLYAFDGTQWHNGIYALYELAKRVPYYWPFVLLLKLSIWTKTGQHVYDFIASRRTIVPVGHCADGVCKLGERKGK